LSSSQALKGGLQLLQRMNLESDTTYVFSGKKPESTKKHEAKNIRFIWIQDQDYFDFLRQCRLVVCNSKFKEGWCKVAHEAISVGTPVIGSGSGGMQELFSLHNIDAMSEIEMVNHFENLNEALIKRSKSNEILAKRIDEKLKNINLITLKKLLDIEIKKC